MLKYVYGRAFKYISSKMVLEMKKKKFNFYCRCGCLAVFLCLMAKFNGEQAYDKGIIYKPSRYTVEYVDENDFPDLTAYDLHLNNKVNNVEEYLLSLCTEKNYYEYSNGTTLREYTSEFIPQLFPKFKEIKEITKSDYVFSISYYATDGKEVLISYKDNDVVEKFVYEESSDTAYHYYDGKYSIEYHFREPYSITMSEGLSNRLNILLSQKRYDEIEKIKGLKLYRFDDGEVVVDFDMDLIVNGELSKYSQYND